MTHLISAALIYSGLAVIAFGLVIAGRSAALTENDAEKLAVGARPHELKWILVQRGRTVSRGLAMIVLGLIANIAGVLMMQLFA